MFFRSCGSKIELLEESGLVILSWNTSYSTYHDRFRLNSYSSVSARGTLAVFQKGLQSDDMRFSALDSCSQMKLDDFQLKSPCKLLISPPRATMADSKFIPSHQVTSCVTVTSKDWLALLPMTSFFDPSTIVFRLTFNSA